MPKLLLHAPRHRCDRLANARRITAAAMIGLASLAGCAATTPAGPRDRDQRVTNPGHARTSATAGSTSSTLGQRAGVEMVLTDRNWPTFDEARDHAVAGATDGSPLWLRIRAAQPLGELALPADPDGAYAFSQHPHFYLHVIEGHSARTVATCYLTLTAEATRHTEFSVSLAPATRLAGNVPADCWLAAATFAGAREQPWRFELAGYRGRRFGWLAQSDPMATISLAADFSGGTSRYAALRDRAAFPQTIAATATREAEGDRARSLSPDDGSNRGARLTERVVTAAADATARSYVVARSSAAARPDTTQPERVAQPVAPAPDPNPDPDPARAVDRGPTRVVLHFHASHLEGAARARALSDRLRADPGTIVEIRAVERITTADNIRVFFESDRWRAEQTRERIAADAQAIRDFSNYRPQPRPGTIEVWLAGP